MLAYNKNIIHYDQVSFIPEISEGHNTLESINVINCLNRLKDKNIMIISIDAAIVFDNIKFLHNRVGARGNLPQHDKGCR